MKHYTKKEQLQMEYQWWLEQRMTALHEGDIQYVKKCEVTMGKLWEDIKIEFSKVDDIIPKEVKKNFFQRLFGI
jgi:hypothetical protein